MAKDTDLRQPNVGALRRVADPDNIVLEGAASGERTMVKLVVRWCLAGVTCSIGACRAHEAVCTGDECAAEPSEGGAPSSELEGTSGEAGASTVPSPGCLNDQQCQNEFICDGEEVCTLEGCEPGPKYECEHGTTCVDQAPERCVYEEPSPWLLANSLGGLVALPTARLGTEPAFMIAPNPGQGLFEGFSEISWSPDGQVAIIGADEEQWGKSFHYARFGDGLPSKVLPLPDVPDYVITEERPEFSPDSEYVFLHDDVSGTYLLNLKDSSVPNRHIPLFEGAVVETTFCADSRSWLTMARPDGEYHHRAWITTLEGDELVQTPIDSMNSAQVSRDRRLLVLDLELDFDGNDLGFVLRPCSSEPWSVAFPDGHGYDFSPDSKWLYVEDAAGVQRVLSLEDPSSPEEIFSSESLGASLFSNFTPDSRYLEADVDGVANLVDLGQASTQPLVPLPGIGSIAVLESAALLAWSRDEAARDQLVWQSIPPSGMPVPLLENVTTDDWRFVVDEVEPTRVFLVHQVQETNELFSVRLDGSPPEIKSLLTIDGTIVRLTSTPDQSGILFTRIGDARGGPLMFAPFEPSGDLGSPVLVSDSGYEQKLQPWP